MPPRAGHSTVAFGNNLLVFGGFTDAQNLYDDLYMLDVGMYNAATYKIFSVYPNGTSVTFPAFLKIVLIMLSRNLSFRRLVL